MGPPRFTRAEDRWRVEGMGWDRESGSKSSPGKLRHAWRCARQVLALSWQPIDSTTEGLGSWGGGAGGGGVCSNNLKQRDQPLSGVLALVSEVSVSPTKWHRRSSSRVAPTQAGLC